MNFTNLDLKTKLGKIAIMEGDFTIDNHGFLHDVKKIMTEESIVLELMNIYRDNSQFIKLVEKNIDTILIETTFTYENKIYDVANFLIDLYQKTGWKPKQIINTMDYGLEALFIICNQLKIDVYKIDDSDDFDIGDFKLKKIELNEIQQINFESRYYDLNELVKSKLKKN